MKNLEIIKAYHKKIWVDKDLKAIEEHFAKDAHIHSQLKTIQGIEAMVELISKWHDAFNDLEVFWDDFICDGTKVVSRWHAKGHLKAKNTTQGSLHEATEYTGVTIYQVEDAKIVKYWSIIDMSGLKEAFQ